MYLFHIVLLATILKISFAQVTKKGDSIDKNEEKVAEELKLRYKTAFYDSVSSEEEYYDYNDPSEEVKFEFNPSDFLHRNFQNIKEQSISKSVTDGENQKKNSKHQKLELENLIKKISVNGNETINLVNSIEENDELDNSEEQKLRENVSDRNISERIFPIFLTLNEGRYQESDFPIVALSEVLKPKKKQKKSGIQPTNTKKKFEDYNRNNNLKKNKNSKPIANYNNLPYPKNIGVREENNKKLNKANQTNKNSSPQRKSPQTPKKKDDTKIISEKLPLKKDFKPDNTVDKNERKNAQKKVGITKPPKKTLLKTPHNGQENFKVQTTRPSFREYKKSDEKHKKTKQKDRIPLKYETTSDKNQEEVYLEDNYYDDYGLREESEEDVIVESSSEEEPETEQGTTELDTDENQSDESGDSSTSEDEDSIEDDSSDSEASNVSDSNETDEDEDEDSDSEESYDDYTEQKNTEKRGSQIVEDASKLSPNLLKFDNNHKLKTSCDHTWTYIDKPLRMLEKEIPKYRRNSFGRSTWMGFKPKEGNLLDLLGNFCGSLPACANGSSLSMSPWVPLLLKKSTKVERFLSIRCGVTLISKSHAITSARCVLKANTDPLYIIFGNFDFGNTDRDGIVRVVETIALAGEDLRLAVLTFKELSLHDQIRPICITPDDSFDKNTRTATVVWNWSLEESDKTDDVIYENFCAMKKRSDKKMSELLPAKVCPKTNGLELPICMRTKAEALWSDDDTIPGLPLMYEYQNSWFLKGILLEEAINESNKKVQKRQIRRIKFESIDRFIDDLNKIITQVA